MDEKTMERIACSTVDKQFRDCQDRFISREYLEDKLTNLWDFARSRAHKGMMALVILFLASILLLSIKQMMAMSVLDKNVSLAIQRVEAQLDYLEKKDGE